jgi:RimJ/RimL family protein N-acetyltransferase
MVVPPRAVTTERLLLRAPLLDDAEAIHARYASDPDVTRYLGWQRHRSLADTRGFLEFASAVWDKGCPIAFLAFLREGGLLVGSTGLVFERAEAATTGYALARDAWGHGFATEMTLAMVDLAFRWPNIWRLSAICHLDNQKSERVLSKAGFIREGTLRRHTVFPNLGTPRPQDVALWARVREE